MATSTACTYSGDLAAPAVTLADSHRVPLSGGSWTVWRTVALRGAGFPASMVSRLAAEGASAAADRYIDAHAEVIDRRRAALARLAAARATSSEEERRLVRARERRLKKGLVASDGTPEEAALASAVEARHAAYAQLIAAYEADCAVLHAQLLAAIDDPRFREAAIWQNASAFRIACRQLRTSSDATRRTRAAELVAMLLQRYTVKNDSIGFFGPIGWAAVVDRPIAIEPSVPPELLARREVYFEAWCIDAIADRIAADPRAKPWTAPRVKAGVWLGPDGVYAPGAGRLVLTAAERRVLAACDGIATAHEIAAALAAERYDIARSPEAVYELLEGLVRAGLVAWHFEVAPQLHPERELQARIARFGDPELRHEYETAVSSIVEGRRRVARAAGDPESLAAAIDDLNAAFESATGQSSTRHHGMTYGARTLVYEDCRRAGDVDIGTVLMERLGPPLTIVLDAMRWLAVEFASNARRRIAQCHAEQGGGDIDAQTFFVRASRATQELWRTEADRIRTEFQARWRSVLELDDGERLAHRAHERVAARARTAFATSGRAWTRADHVCPDIMVAAAGRDAVRRGELHCVLGEVHGYNTVLTSAVLAQHPQPDAVLDAMADESGADVPILVQRLRIDEVARTRMLGVHPTCWRFEWGDEPPALPRCRPLPAGRFVATNDEGVIRMQARDGTLSFDAIELFAPLLVFWVNRVFADLVASERHTPRVTVDDLTIARERWNIPAREMHFLEERDPVLQFARLRAWARAEGMPRHVFYLAPRERKPCYLDFDSPIYLDIFVRLMKRAAPDASVRIVEMMPCIDDTWLTDANGMQYTSELRFVARFAGQESRVRIERNRGGS